MSKYSFVGVWVCGWVGVEFGVLALKLRWDCKQLALNHVPRYFLAFLTTAQAERNKRHEHTNTQTHTFTGLKTADSHWSVYSTPRKEEGSLSGWGSRGLMTGWRRLVGCRRKEATEDGEGRRRTTVASRAFHTLSLSPSLHVGGIISLACNQDISSACKCKNKHLCMCICVNVYACFVCTAQIPSCPDSFLCILVLLKPHFQPKRLRLSVAEQVIPLCPLVSNRRASPSSTDLQWIVHDSPISPVSNYW